MRLFNLTFNRFPAKTAEAIYVREISKGFTQNIGPDYLLIVGNDTSDELKEIPHHTIGFKRKKFRTAYYFLWIPYFIFFVAKAKRNACFFSNDQFLLASLIVWKKILRFRSIVCADWHMFSETWKDKFIAKNADVHISTTEHLRDQIIRELDAKPERILTVYGGVSKNAFEDFGPKSELRKALGLPVEKVLIGYVGLFRTLGMEKGLTTMIESLQYLSTDTYMVFVGGKVEEIAFYKEVAERYGVSERCIFFEKVSSREVLKYEHAMDVLVIPYPDQPHYRKYGFPMKAYEYLASGVPVVYSNLPIINEVFEGNGSPFVPDNAKSLALAIDATLNDQTRSENMILKIKEKAKAYTWKEKAKRILEFISKYEK